MEESSDESGEMITKEEAEVAELEQKTAGLAMTQSPVSPPAPLPSFMTQTTPGGSVPSQTVPGPTHTTAGVQGPTHSTAGVPGPTHTTAGLPGPTQTATPGVPGPPPTATPGVPGPPPTATPGVPGPAVGVTQVSTGVPTVPTPQWTPQQPVSPQQTPQVPPVYPPQTVPQFHQVQAPAPIERPIDVSQSIQIPEGTEMVPMSPQSPDQKGGLFGWFSGNKMISKVVEKTKSSMENMITMMDPGMKEVIRTGGDICIAVTSTKENKVGAIREAFQQMFGKAIVMGEESQATTAAQPVGFTAGLKGAEERIQNLRQSGTIDENQAIVSVEGFIIEMLPDRWYEMSCLVLQDPMHRIDLQTFSQPSPIPAEYILKAQDRTPADYPLRWLGLAVTIGQVIEETLPHIGHADWQNGIVGVSRRESLLLAAKSLAYMYKQRLPTTFVS